MERPRECKGCGITFDSAAFSTGRKYCKPACRFNYEGHSLCNTNPAGRPRRFKKADSLTPITTKQFLERRGFRITYGDGDKALRAIVRRGHTGFRLCVGGNPFSAAGNESWAQICAHIKEGELTFTSTCTKQPTIKNLPMGIAGKTKTRKVRIPCKKEGCTKCTQWKRFMNLLWIAKRQLDNGEVPT